MWSHSREEYVALRQWWLHPDGAPRDDRVAGTILSYVWHILFIQQEEQEGSCGVELDWLNGIACPRAEECYCRLYGRCELEGCTTGSCRGQYRVSPDYKVPTEEYDTIS